jgi:hypothetical protein
MTVLLGRLARRGLPSVLLILLSALVLVASPTAHARASAPPYAAALAGEHQADAGVIARADRATAGHHPAQGTDLVDGADGRADPSGDLTASRPHGQRPRTSGPAGLPRVRAPPAEDTP